MAPCRHGPDRHGPGIRGKDSGIANLAAPDRIWIIPSIHGEAARLDALHGQIRPRLRAGDRIVYLGNYLGYGPDPCATLDALIAFRADLLSSMALRVCDLVYLRGRQEEIWERLLRLQFAEKPVAVLSWMRDQGAEATIASYGGDIALGYEAASRGTLPLSRWTNRLRLLQERRPGHLELMAALSNAAVARDAGVLFVNAGLDPSRPLEAQGDLFWWMDGLTGMREPYADFNRVVRGFHRDAPGLRTTAFHTTLDGGAGRGGGLLCACLDHRGQVVDLIDA